MVVAARAQKRRLRSELRHQGEAESVAIERDVTGTAANFKWT
jgi:hypothetical protein